MVGDHGNPASADGQNGVGDGFLGNLGGLACHRQARIRRRGPRLLGPSANQEIATPIQTRPQSEVAMFVYSLLLTAVIGANAPDRIVIETDRVSLELTAQGAIRGAVDKRSGRELFSTPKSVSLFRLDFSEGEGKPARMHTCFARQAERVRLEPGSRGDRKSTRLHSRHRIRSRMPSSA